MIILFTHKRKKRLKYLIPKENYLDDAEKVRFCSFSLCIITFLQFTCNHKFSYSKWHRQESYLQLDVVYKTRR